jgi:hypothetical protein
MAIRRCPYCKAIIDEQDKYCDNCGTQLLFPEDEFVEEEIPGDKIIDKDEPEDGSEKENPDEEQELEAELEEEEEDELGGPEAREASPGSSEDKEEDEEEDVGEELELEAELEEEEEADEAEEEEEEEEGGEAPLEMAGHVPGKPPGEEIFEPESGPADAAWKLGPADSEKKYEVSIEQDELVFKTKDLEKLTGTVDEGKRELENFLESHREFTSPQSVPDTKEGLPPWVSRIRETPATVEPEEAAREEAPPARRKWTTDSGIGVPEKITEAALPFGDTGDQTSETADEGRESVDEETEESMAEEGGAQRPVSPSLKLRAKIVDWVFVTALWLISLGFTAQVLGVSFFRLIFSSTVPVLAFYVILLVLYFFLFLYFLGETPGDHYFSEED